MAHIIQWDLDGDVMRLGFAIQWGLDWDPMGIRMGIQCGLVWDAVGLSPWLTSTSGAWMGI